MLKYNVKRFDILKKMYFKNNLCLGYLIIMLKSGNKSSLGIQNTTVMDNDFEHLALVTFGGTTRVHQHLTCDYIEIRRKLGNFVTMGVTDTDTGNRA